MIEKHDSEITPLPAPLPGLSIEVDAVSSQAATSHELSEAHSNPGSAANREDTDPQLAPPGVVARRRRQWLIIGGLGLCAVVLGGGALLWQPAPPAPNPPPIAQPPVAPPPIVPSPPVAVTPIAPPPGVPQAESAPTATAQAELPAAPPVAAPSEPAVASPGEPAATQPGPDAKSTTDSRPPRVTAGHAAKPAAPQLAVRTKPAAPRPALAPEPPRVPPVSLEPVKQLSQATMRQLMLGAEARWKSCVKEAWGTNISIGIVVESSGQVQKADILGPLSTSATGRCITEHIRKLRFPPFTEGGATKQFFWSYQIPAS